MRSPDEPREPHDAGAIGPYLAVVAVAVGIGVGIAVYVFGYRDEILAILTQLPT